MYQIALHDMPELVESTLYPGLDDAHEQCVDVFDEMEGQLDKEVNRVKELMVKIEQSPGASTIVKTIRSELG